MKIVIEVKGGLVQAIHGTEDAVSNLQILLLDFDNEELDEGEYKLDSVMTDKGITEYIEREIKLHNPQTN